MTGRPFRWWALRGLTALLMVPGAAVAVVVVAFVVNSLEHFSLSSFERGLFSTTASLEPVDLSLQRHGSEPIRFRVPEAYLSFALNRAGGAQHHLLMEAWLPEMVPEAVAIAELEAQGLSEEEIAKERLHRKVYLHLQPSGNYLIRRIQKKGRLPDEVEKDFPVLHGLHYLGRAKNEHSSVGESGIHFAIDENSEVRRVLRPLKDFYIPIEIRGPEGLFLYCIFPDYFPYGKCSIRRDFRENLFGSIKFHSARLPEWSAIDDKATAFVNTLIVGEK